MPLQRFFTVLLLLFNLSLFAQQTDYPAVFADLLRASKAELMQPLDGGYKSAYVPENDVQHYHYALFSRKEKLEIRYFLRPETTIDWEKTLPPHMEAHRLAMHLCTNEEDVMITKRDLTPHELVDLFNADFGTVYMFRPKRSFSDALHCKMILLYKEGHGLTYIFNLFDEPSPEVDNRLYTFRYLNI